MAIIPGKPSAERQQVFEAALLHVVQLGRVPSGLRINPNPQPIFVISVSDLAGDFKVTDVARLVSWRYFAGDVSGAVVAGDVSATSPITVTSLRYGDSARKALQALLALESLPQVRANDFEARLLRIPGALVESIWLKPRADAGGLVIQLNRVFGPRPQDGIPDSVDDFLKNLRPVAPSIPPEIRRPTARRPA